MRKVRADWCDLAEGLDLTYGNCPTDDEVLVAAHEHALWWAGAFRDAREEPWAEDLAALTAEAEEISRCHWSPLAVLPALLDVPALVCSVNELCQASPDCDGGVGIVSSWEEDSRGVRFQVDQPILLGRVATRRAAELPDDVIPLREFGSGDLITMMREAAGPITIDLFDWANEMQDPTPEEVVRFVLRQRRSRAARSSRQIRAGEASSDK